MLAMEAWTSETTANLPKWKTATVQAEFICDRKRRRDADNFIAWLKYAFDGLVSSNILSDDDKLTHLPPLQTVRSGDRPRIIVTVTGG